MIVKASNLVFSRALFLVLPVLAAVFGPAIAAADLPVILEQPTPQNVSSGANASLRISASGTPPLTYQWVQNGSKVPSRTGAILSFEPLLPERAGFYHVIVSNPAGSVTSSVVSLSIGLPGSELSLRPRGSVTGFELGDGSGAPVRIQVRGRYAYVANGWDTNLYVVDIADPDKPTTVASVAGVGPFKRFFDVAFIDDFVLTAERDQGLGIIDVRNPLRPVRIENFKMPGGLVNSVTVQGRRAFVGNEDAGLVVLDVNSPDHPFVLGKASPPFRANGFHLADDRAYVANWVDGLSVVDIKNVLSPTEFGSFSYNPSASRAFDVTTFGSFAYVGDSDLGLVTIDTTRRTGFQTSRIGGSIWDLSRLGRFLFTADANAGLRIFDVSTPKTPVELGRYGGFGRALGCTIRGNRAFLGQRHFSVADLSFASMAPVFSSAPEQRAVILGSDVVLEANTTGSEPLTFRWFRGDQELAEFTGPALIQTNVSAEALGQYSVVVANPFGSITNQIATLSANTRIPDEAIWLSPNPSTPLVRGESYSLKATTTLARPVQFMLDSGTASLTDNLLQTLSDGPLTLRVVVAGDSTHLPAAATRDFTVISRPELLANSIQTDSGQTKFRVLIGTGVRFAVMASEDLSHWREIAQMTATQPDTEVTDPEAQPATRYYRIEVR
jgi:hypothetical protein